MNARGIPIDVAVGAVRALLPLGRTWRFRHPDAPGRRYRPRLPQAVYACWHEHLLPIALWLSDRGFATLASEDRDGEIITRVLHRLGYAVARGSSTRGGAEGYRDLLRAVRAGRPIIVTCDGPRGPRREAKPGTARLAERTGLPLVPIGLAATHGARLSSWDRFLIPAPGTRVYVATGSAVPSGTSLAVAVDGVTHLCEQVARESRRGRPPDVERGPRATGPGPRGPTGSPGPGRGLETRVRAAWTSDPPPRWLRGLSAPFVIARSIRGGLYDAGILREHAASIPIVSVGGVTVGGSGKTPLAADIAKRLEGRGASVAILTRGYEDEMRLHRSWNPRARVWGHPDRVRLVERAAAEGASCAVLDDGFQHRRLARDLEILAIDLDALARTNGRSLPAGPFRENWRNALSRSDLIVLTSRSDTGAEPGPIAGAGEPGRGTPGKVASPRGGGTRVGRAETEVREAAGRRAPGAPVLRLRIGSGAPRPATEAARERVGPTVALTGVMKPNLFFASARRVCPTIRDEIALPDHGWPDAATLRWIEGLDGGGVLLTDKDLARFGDAISHVALWTLPDRLSWDAGEDALDAALERLMARGFDRGTSRPL